MADSRDFVAGLVVGGLVGFVAGLMLAPASGRETREAVADKTQVALDKTQVAVKETRESVEEASEVFVENVNKVTELIKERFPEPEEAVTDDELETEIELMAQAEAGAKSEVVALTIPKDKFEAEPKAESV